LPPDELSALVIEGLTLEILGETARRSTNSSRKQSPPHWLVQAREILREQFCENLSLTEIARTVGVHETHLSREFRRFYGGTLGEYARARRIEFACHRLLHSNDSLAEIACAAGFFDQSHFTRIFKSQIGMTPQQYRCQWRSR
jgi:AraC family transcriptional regulator